MAVRSVTLVALLVGTMTVFTVRLSAGESATALDVNSAAVPAPMVDEPHVKLTPQQTEKKRKAYSAVAAVAGIAIAGLALAALTILWAGRLRRLLRQTDPACTAIDKSFWFLKPPKPRVKDSSLPELQRAASEPPPQVPPPSEQQ